MIKDMNQDERTLLMEALNQREDKKIGVTDTGQPPSWSDLNKLAFHQSIPFIGFGFLDNFIMIVAGEYIDSSIGASFCIRYDILCIVILYDRSTVILDVFTTLHATVVPDHVLSIYSCFDHVKLSCTLPIIILSTIIFLMYNCPLFLIPLFQNAKKAN